MNEWQKMSRATNHDTSLSTHIHTQMQPHPVSLTCPSLLHLALCLDEGAHRLALLQQHEQELCRRRLLCELLVPALQEDPAIAARDLRTTHSCVQSCCEQPSNDGLALLQACSRDKHTQWGAASLTARRQEHRALPVWLSSTHVAQSRPKESGRAAWVQQAGRHAKGSAEDAWRLCERGLHTGLSENSQIKNRRQFHMTLIFCLRRVLMGLDRIFESTAHGVVCMRAHAIVGAEGEK